MQILLEEALQGADPLCARFPGGGDLLHYNDLLDEGSALTALNERFLEGKLAQLDRSHVSFPEIYWLTLARLTELTLLCAGNYADNGELGPLGDLLINPRRIEIHVLGWDAPMVKERHSRLSDQFGSVAETRSGVMEWLKGRTFLRIKSKPLLPHLHEQLTKAGYLSRGYLESVERRMMRISEAVGVLAACHLPEETSLYQRLQRSSESDRSFILSKLCRFDRTVFNELGRDISRFAADERHRSPFLC